MKSLLVTIAISSLLHCQAFAFAGNDSDGAWQMSTFVGVSDPISSVDFVLQDPKPVEKKAEPKPVKKQDPRPAEEAKKPAANKQDPKPAEEAKKPAANKQDPKPVDVKSDPGSAGTGTEEPRIDRPEKDQPLPAGNDPADIAAMKSAEDMLRAEKRLQEEIKSGKLTGLDKILPFDELTSWPYEDGLKGMPKRVKKLSGQKVLMTGFMLPIDEVQNIKEFLLVESLWSCCYGQPPDIHGIVRVVMPKDKTTDYFFDPLKLVGTFKVEATMMDGYCVDIFQLHCESLEALKFK